MAVVPFTFGPDWSTSYKVSREFKTDIITSRSGKEQRRALRDTPRKALEFDITLGATDARAYHAFLARARGQTVQITEASTGAVLQGRFAGDTQGTWPTNGALQASLHFDVDPGSEPGAPPAAATTFNGREVFTLRPNWGEQVGLTYSQTFDTLDYGQGRILRYDPVAYLHRTFKAAFVGRTAPDVAALEANFLRAKGRRGEFYMPTWRDDLPLAQPVTGGANAFLTPGTDATAWAGDTVFCAVAVVMVDGSLVMRRVTGIAAASGASEVSVDLPFATGFGPGDVQMISWLPVWRHATDILVTEWLTDSVGQIQLTLQSLEDLQPAA